MRRFEAIFDQAVTFGRSKSLTPLPFVLRAREPAGFEELKHAIDASLGICPGPAFVPHITLLYDAKIVRPTTLEPITWEVEEFVLIHAPIKERGRPKQPYSIVGRWQLN